MLPLGVAWAIAIGAGETCLDCHRTHAQIAKFVGQRKRQMRISTLTNGSEYVAANSRGAPFAHNSQGYAAHRFLSCPIRQCDSERRKTQDRLKLVSGLESTINQVDRGRYRYTQHERAEHEYIEDLSRVYYSAVCPAP